LGRQLRSRIGPSKFVRVRVQAQRLDLLQLFLALLKLVAWLKLQRENPFRIIAGEYSGQRHHRARM
jgi:hypothetical protein